MSQIALCMLIATICSIQGQLNYVPLGHLVLNKAVAAPASMSEGQHAMNEGS